jgi:hypothetical protein
MNVWADVCCSDLKWPISEAWFERVAEKTGLADNRSETPTVCVCSDGVVVMVRAMINAVDGIEHWVRIPRADVDASPDFNGAYEHLPVHGATMAEMETEAWPEEERVS